MFSCFFAGSLGRRDIKTESLNLLVKNDSDKGDKKKDILPVDPNAELVKRFLENPFSGKGAALVNRDLFVILGLPTVFIHPQINWDVVKQIASTLGVVLEIIEEQEGYLKENGLVDSKLDAYYAYFGKKVSPIDFLNPIEMFNFPPNNIRYKIDKPELGNHRAGLVELVLGMLTHFKLKGSLKFWEGRITTLVCESKDPKGNFWLLKCVERRICFERIKYDSSKPEYKKDLISLLKDRKMAWLYVYGQAPLFSNLKIPRASDPSFIYSG